MKSFQKPVAILLSIMLIFSSCSDDDNVNPDNPPELPPVETMEMDFSTFSNQDEGGRVAEMQHWSQAALVVGVWSTVIGVTLAVPVAAFKASVSQTPEYDAEQELWTWTFDYDFVGRTYSAELTGALVEEGVEWNMYVSQEDGFQDFLWYSGTMDREATNGRWNVNLGPNNPVEFLQIDWQREGDGIGSIRYTDINDNSANTGGYIEYGRTEEGGFNTFYNLYSAKEDRLILIEWSETTGEGRIKIGDEAYKCWDADFQDVACE